MQGETNLAILLKSMHPILNAGEYVFCTTNTIDQINPYSIVSFFKEKEGITLILERKTADELGLDYSFIAAWITLTVHSSLDAVGLTAAFSTAMAKENISCNIVAGYYHDHIFVPQNDAQKAMETLAKLSRQ